MVALNGIYRSLDRSGAHEGRPYNCNILNLMTSPFMGARLSNGL